MYNKIQINSLFSKILFSFLALIIFKIGLNIPIYGINSNLIVGVDSHFNKVLDSLNIFSGGALSQASIFSLAVIPFITASIFVQLLSIKIPYLINLKENDQSGKKIKTLTRFLTIFIASFQSYYLCQYFLKTFNQNEIIYISVLNFYIFGGLSLVVGSLFITWIAEKVTERGFGNGVSFIIFIGVCSSFINIVKDFNMFITSDKYGVFSLIAISFFMLSIFYFIVFIEKTQKRISINIINNKKYDNKNYLPFKVNMGGIMPAIIAGIFVGFPLTIVSFLGNFFDFNSFKIKELFSMGGIFYYIFMFLLLSFFSFYYLKIISYDKKIKEMIENSDLIVSGLRPGIETRKYIDSVINRLTYISIGYIFLIIIIPDVFFLNIGLSFYFGGTGLLIVIITSVDWIKEFSMHFSYLKYRNLKNKIDKSI